MTYNSIFLGSFKSKEDIADCFEINRHQLDDLDVLFAIYDQDGYDASAFVLFRNPVDGKLYEVYGSHCSCFGLEGQWDPEETTKEAVLKIKPFSYIPGGEEVYKVIEDLVKSLPDDDAK